MRVVLKSFAIVEEQEPFLEWNNPRNGDLNHLYDIVIWVVGSEWEAVTVLFTCSMAVPLVRQEEPGLDA